MHDAHQPPGDDDGPTLMFQRSLPGEGRCTICPFGPIGAAPVLPPAPQHNAASHHLTATKPHSIAPQRSAAIHAPANTQPTALPRPALLAADLRGSGTLVLPDALRCAGPDAATIERPSEPYPHPIDTRRDAPRRPPGMAARDPNFDELASPDITVLQPSIPPTSRPVRRRAHAAARVAPARAYLGLNLFLGLLILAGLVLLVTRHAPSTAPSVSASE